MGNMHKKIVEDQTSTVKDIITDRQTYTHRQAHHNTPLPYLGGVINESFIMRHISSNRYILQSVRSWQLHSKPAAVPRFSSAVYHVAVTNRTEAEC